MERSVENWMPRSASMRERVSKKGFPVVSVRNSWSGVKSQPEDTSVFKHVI